MTYRVGVDLGTTYAAAAVVRRGAQPEIVALGNRGTVIPSVVLVTETGGLLVGEAAARRAAADPHRIIREFKRRVGDPTPIECAGHSFSAESLMAELLRTVLAIVAEREGGPPEVVVLTHPANWSDYKRDRLLGELATVGLPPVQTLTEPAAAAASYARRQRVEPGGVVAVYDLGGGTFDAAVLRRTDDSFAVLGKPTGIERLGGIDFDAAVMAHVNRYLDHALDHVDLDDPLVASSLARLRSDAVDAKEALSSETDVTIPVYLPDLRTEVRLTRVEFEAMIRPSLSDTIGCLRRALSSASVDAADLQAVLLVGGSSRIPLVAQLVGAEMGRPVAVDSHPKHAVALGAAGLRAVDRPAVAAGAAAGAAAAGSRPEAPPPRARSTTISMPEPTRPTPPARPSEREPVPAAAVPQVRSTPSVSVPRKTADETPVRSRSPEAVILDPAEVRESPDRGRRGVWLLVVAVLVAVVALGAGVLALQAGDGGGEEAGPTTTAAPSTTEAATTEPTVAGVTTLSTTTTAVTTTDAPTTVPSQAAPKEPIDCVPDSSPFVCMTAIGLDADGELLIDYQATGFIANIGPAPNRHVHFYFPIGAIADNELNAGTSGPAPASWIAWDDPTFGPGFTVSGYNIADAQAVGADEICVLVADSAHAVVPASGNCTPLPDPGGG